MLVTLDGQPARADAAESCTLQELVDAVARARPVGRIIVSIALDGEVLIEPALSQRLNQPLGGVGQVDLESEEIGPLCAAGLREAADCLREAGEPLPELAARVHSESPAAAAEAISNLLSAWRASQQAVTQSAALLRCDLLAEASASTAGAPVAELHSHLTSLRDALLSRDAVLLADLLQFELPELTTTWCGLLEELAVRVESGQLAPTP